MKTLNYKTKKAQQFIRQYDNTNYSMLCDVYKNYSYNKARAESDIVDIMKKRNGYGYKILSHNCMFFTCGYLFNDCDGLLNLRIETPSNTYIMQYIHL